VNLARWPREEPLAERLLWVDPRRGTTADRVVGDLPDLLHANDVLVLNDSATLPASLAGRTDDGRLVEVRLCTRLDARTWLAALFGTGDWRQRTEDRPCPPKLERGDRLHFAAALGAEVLSVSPISNRVVELRFDREDAALWRALYHAGRPIQYSYLGGPLDLWHMQSAFASRPWSVESPSAGRPLRWELILRAIRCGVRVTSITHSAGISSLGEASLDASLPFRERYEISEHAVESIQEARSAGGKVIAVGTTVVRALETCVGAHGGRLVAGPGIADVVIRRAFTRRIVDGIVTGFHEPASSHFEMLCAFAPQGLLRRAYAHAESSSYLWHEFGDSMLILAARG
jgi:S-adenosylmethionine:tRNA ribosyltransferase-isomerase